jgi:hypothetical protein
MNKDQQINGLKIYDTSRNLPSLFDEWRDLNINSLYVGERLLSNNAFRKMAHRYKMRLFAITPIFYDKVALENSPELFARTNHGEIARDDWVRFVCPTREEFILEKIESLVQLLKIYEPDGLSLDFIRHFVFWEKIYPERSVESIPTACFDDSCVMLFQQKLNIEIPDMDGDIGRRSDWILKHHRDEWVDWKCTIIVKVVKEIHDQVRMNFPGCLINLHAVPWRKGDFGGAIKNVAGQDLAALSNHVDMLSPMCYSHMLKREPTWISSVVEELANQSKSQVVPSIQVREHYLSESLGLDEFHRMLTHALRPPSAGVIYWSWEALEKDPEKKEIIRTFL